MISIARFLRPAGAMLAASLFSAMSLPPAPFSPTSAAAAPSSVFSAAPFSAAPFSAAPFSAATSVSMPAVDRPGLWYPPLGPPLRVSAAYSLPNGPYRAGHRGIDLPASRGDAVHSPVAGAISFVGEVADRAVISIRIDARTVVSLEPVTSESHEGDAVERGEAIGLVDTGGHCAASCVHLGVRIDDVYVNPLRFLRQKPVLLPW